MASVTHNEARNTIIAAFNTVWGSTTAVAYDNASYTPPDGNTAWTSFSVQFNGGKQMSIGASGSRDFRRFGIVLIQIFTPAEDSTYNNDVNAMKALNIFDGKTINSVVFYEGAVDTVGVEGKWFQQNVIVYFYFNEIK
jgi:hypothetical protein